MSIERNYPRVTLVKIEMKKLKNDYFETRIKVFTETQSFFVAKNDSNHSESLMKSHRAISKQLDREKPDFLHFYNHENEFSDSVA